MNSRKQNLHDVLLIVVWITEGVGRKERPALVEGNRMPDNIQVGVLGRPREWEGHGVIDPTYRAYRVPDANEMRLAFAGEGFLEPGRDLEVFILHQSDRIRDQAFIALSEQSNNVKHPAQGAGGIGPS